MTEPDPPADLAAQLAELRGELARAQGEIGSFTIAWRTAPGRR